MDPAPTLAGAAHAVLTRPSAAGALWTQALLHGRLAAIEWEEEKHRWLELAGITLAGSACVLCALLFAGGLALSAAWDSGYRIHVFALLILMSVFGASVAWRLFKARPAASCFAASREELAADAAALKADA